VKKFVVGVLFALLGGVTCDASSIWDELRKLMSSEEYKVLHDKTRPIIEELVEVYKTGKVISENQDIMDKVDDKIRELNDMVTKPKIHKHLDLQLAIELHFCPSMAVEEIGEERSIGYEIIERWTHLNFLKLIEYLRTQGDRSMQEIEWPTFK
jgi:hypothetical protein